MRTYEETHPWIKFTADSRRVDTKVWIKLGECQSKCEHLSKVPLRPDTADNLNKVYLAKGVHATTAIEGNTLEEEDVLKQMEGKLKLPVSQEYLQKEIQNIINGFNKIVNEITEGIAPEISVQTIKEMNKTVLNDLPLEKDVIPGEFRSHSVTVGRYLGAPAQECEYLMEKLCEWLNGPDFKAEDEVKIVYALIKAILAHLYIAWIHPFGDGNGRTARLLELQILLASGIPQPAAHLFSNHYNLTRSEYYRQLDEASKSGGDVVPFVRYAIQGFLDNLREQIERVWTQQWDVTWRNYVYEIFKDKNSSSDKRRRNLVLDFPPDEKIRSLDELTGMSARLMTAYMHKTRKTLSRDVNALEKLNLLLKSEKGYYPNREIILSFLPLKARAKS